MWSSGKSGHNEVGVSKIGGGQLGAAPSGSGANDGATRPWFASSTGRPFWLDGDLGVRAFLLFLTGRASLWASMGSSSRSTSIKDTDVASPT